MPGRTFAIGDIHGELGHLVALLEQLPPLEATDSVVFLGDYLDRGPDSRGVIRFLRDFSLRTPARVIFLRGNHEDGWLRVIHGGWDEFVFPPANGCLATVRSFLKDEPAAYNQDANTVEMLALTTGSFFPPDVVAWLQSLPLWHEDEHGIYVHAGLPPSPKGGFSHPSTAENPLTLIWLRKDAFIRHYVGKHVVFGHTPVTLLPQELSDFTPDDPTDLWAGPHATGIDTGCGSGGFLTALELPAMRVYESRTASPTGTTGRPSPRGNV